jgi:stage II sporulation protein M
MEEIPQIFLKMTMFVVAIFIIGIAFGYIYAPLGEATHEYVSNGTSMSIVKTFSTTDLEFIGVIFACNLFVATTLICMSFFGKWFPLVKYAIYGSIGYQIFNVSVLIGYVSTFVSYKMILASILPHGIIEIPAIMLAATLGVYFCQDVKCSLKSKFKAYLHVVVLLLSSAIVEVIATPVFMNFVS